MLLITKVQQPLVFSFNMQLCLITKVNSMIQDFWTYCDSYRIVLEQLRQPKNIFIYNNSSKMRYITTAHFVK